MNDARVANARVADAWVADAVRTPIGRVHGQLAGQEVQDLLAPLIKALLERNVLGGAEVDEVIVGNAAGPGGNPARVALLQAGLPVSVPGLSVDRQCGSGLEAINLGVRLVQSGAARVVLAGGVESASTAPLRARASASLEVDPEFYHRARFAPDAIGDPEMGVAAENVAKKCGISRARQDAFALSSHRKAIAARHNRRFDAELLPFDTGLKRMIADECPREDTSLQRLAGLPAAFEPGGTVTAGNACPVNDGAALVLICAEQPAASRHAAVSLRFLHAAAAGVDPNLLGLGPVPAVQAVLQRAGLAVEDLAQVEFNEAFAAQVLACVDALQLDTSRLNPDGGALALGHPYGASGAVLVTRLLHSLQPGQLGLATLGIGGGLGLASLFEAV